VVIQIASCSSGETYYPVSGLVKVDGKPASGALLTFHPDPPGDPKTTFPATAKAGTDGKFTLTTGANGGVKAGKYFVTIIWPDPNKKLTDAQRMMGAVPELQDEAAVPDVVAVLQAGLRIGVVLRHHRNRHRVLGQDVHRHDVVRDEVDGIDRREFAVDVHHEPVVGVDVRLHGVVHLRLDEAGRTSLALLVPLLLLGLIVLGGEVVKSRRQGERARREPEQE